MTQAQKRRNEPKKEFEIVKTFTDRVLQFSTWNIDESNEDSICPRCKNKRHPNMYGWYCQKCKEQFQAE